MQARRDNPESAKAELVWRCNDDEPGISPALSFDPAEDIAATVHSDRRETEGRHPGA